MKTLTTGQLAKLTSVPQDTLRRLCEDGKIPARRIPPTGYWRINSADVDAIKGKLAEWGLMTNDGPVE